MELGLDEEGLFRLSAGQAKVRKGKKNVRLKSFGTDQQVKRLRAEIEAGQVSILPFFLKNFTNNATLKCFTGYSCRDHHDY